MAEMTSYYLRHWSLPWIPKSQWPALHSRVLRRCNWVLFHHQQLQRGYYRTCVTLNEATPGGTVSLTNWSQNSLLPGDQTAGFDLDCSFLIGVFRSDIVLLPAPLWVCRHQENLITKITEVGEFYKTFFFFIRTMLRIQDQIKITRMIF